MALHVETVTKALNHERVSFLPRGELFVDRVFLDRYFFQYEGQYVKQLELAAQTLGLSLIGIWLDTKWSDSLLSEMKYKDLEPYFTVGCISGPISILIENHGFFDAMTSLRNEPSLFSDAAAHLLRDVEQRARLAHENGFRAIAITDDIAGNGGLLFSYEYFLERLCPVYKEIARIIKGEGLFTFFHSDGDTRKMIGPLIEAGYDCIHPVDAQAGLSLYELRREFGERVSFMGHIEILAWDKERIQNGISLAEDQFKTGGLILGSTCGISMEAVNDNLGLLHPLWERRGVSHRIFR